MMNPSQPTYTLLLIDDVKPQLQQLIGCLQAAPGSFNLLSATTEVKALQLAQNVCPDLVVINERFILCQQPKLISQLKMIADHTPLLILSDSSQGSPLEANWQTQHNVEYIRKPIYPREFYSRLHHLLQFAKLHQQVQAQKNHLRVQQQRLTHQKNQELVTQSLKIQEKNRVLLKIAEELQTLDFPPLHPIRNEVRKLIRKIDNCMDQASEWQVFKNCFDQIHPSFFEKLETRFPKLTLEDMKHCAYIKIGLSNKEIAQMLNINPRSVVMHHYRLKKKIPMESTSTLSDYIRRLNITA